ncbi:bifunctional DedA family/phosphatase PAP2 family protein [Azotobacter bryophylli]|uniref:Bifunctional DedA family/phosphatase PAP2 family protein n=1 Tax=Azotobacter bryophylli TaxID=1986537 RepID=A0ABV7AVX0_9GAMM
MSAWIDSLTGWLTANPEWLGLTIFLLACAECLAVVGIIIPGTVLMFAVAVMAGSGALTAWETLLLGYAGGLLGDAISYAVGRRFHQSIRRLPVLRHHPEWMVGAEAYFQRYGTVSLLVGRYIGPLRPMLPMIAGMLDMPLPRFILVSLLAASGWSVAYLLPGWTTGAALRLPLPEGFWREAAVVLVALAVVVGVIAHSSLRRQRWTVPLAACLCLTALIALLLGWMHLHELDNGLMTLIQQHRNASLDRVMEMITVIGDFHTMLYASVLLSLLLLLAKQWRAALLPLGVLLVAGQAGSTLKLLFCRMRPEVLLNPLTSYSLPSGHSTSAFAFFLVLGILAGREQPPRMRLTWLLLACLPATAVALSRVYLGVHWPTDIIAGALLAGAVCAAILALAQWNSPLTALNPRAWWLVLPACLALLGGVILWRLPLALEMYRY